MSFIKKITISSITDVRQDQHGRNYRLIYSPEKWSVDPETGKVTKTQSEKHFCYDESVFELLKPGVEINIESV